MTPPLGQTPHFSCQNAIDSKQVMAGVFRGHGHFRIGGLETWRPWIAFFKMLGGEALTLRESLAKFICEDCFRVERTKNA